LIDLRTGTVQATGVDDAGFDALSGTWVWVTGSTVHGSSEGHDPWQRTLASPPSIQLVDSGLVYLRLDSTVQALNALTGRDAQVYPPDAAGGFAIPRVTSASGAAAFRVNGEVLIAVVERPPG